MFWSGVARRAYSVGYPIGVAAILACAHPAPPSSRSPARDPASGTERGAGTSAGSEKPGSVEVAPADAVSSKKDASAGFWGQMIASGNEWRVPEQDSDSDRYLRVTFEERRDVDGVTIVDLDWKIVDGEREIALSKDGGNRWQPSSLAASGDRGGFFRYESDAEIAKKVLAERPGPPDPSNLGTRYCTNYTREVRTESGTVYCQGEERDLEPDGPCFIAKFCFDQSGVVRVEGELIPDGYGPFVRSGYQRLD